MTTTTVQSCEDALDRLTTTVNAILIETGRFFRAPGSVQSQSRVRRALPAANEEFQSALDYLSEQIFLAKTVLERDYQSIQAAKSTRMTNLTPEPAISDQEHVDTKSVGLPVTQGTAPLDPNKIPAAFVTASQPRGQENTLTSEMSDLGSQRGGKYIAHPPRQPSPPDFGALTAPSMSVSADNDTIRTESGNPPELEAVNGSHPSRNAGNLRTSPSEANVSGAGNFPPLQGLESYANALAEDPSTSNEQASSGPASAKHEERSPEMPMEDIPPTESNFDNMFVGADFGEGEDLLNNVEIGELDDSWFT